MRAWPMLLLVGCAAGRVEPASDADIEPADTGTDRGGVMLDGGTGDANDASVMDSGVDAFDAGCSTADAGLGGIGIPMGTTASATSTYSTDTPDHAIDGDLGTGWNAGGFSGSLTITFPSAQSMNGVRLAAAASPGSSETYNVYGIQSSTPTLIGAATLNVPQGVSVLAPISVQVGSYDAIRIDVTAQSSWAAIIEVSVLTPNCP
jgi:hypothetical protein